jgi:chorismate mutase
MWCRGIRGATVLAANTRDEILQATRELLGEMVRSNGVEREDVACVFFTATADINAEFPAAAARQMGWTDVALLCSQEMEVPESLPRCVRILILYNTVKKSEEIVHVYLRGAEVLRQMPPGLEART